MSNHCSVRLSEWALRSRSCQSGPLLPGLVQGPGLWLVTYIVLFGVCEWLRWALHATAEAACAMPACSSYTLQACHGSHCSPHCAAAPATAPHPHHSIPCPCAADWAAAYITSIWGPLIVLGSTAGKAAGLQGWTEGRAVADRRHKQPGQLCAEATRPLSLRHLFCWAQGK